MKTFQVEFRYQDRKGPRGIDGESRCIEPAWRDCQGHPHVRQRDSIASRDLT